MKKVLGLSMMVLLVVGLVFINVAFAAQDDSTLSQHVKEADGTSGQNTNSGAGIKTGHIQDGAVTNSKIAGNAITSDKILDGAISPSKVGFYNNVLIVAPIGGDFANPVDAVNEITDASATNPYLVKIMPGDYNLGTSSFLQMKSYVDIEGSGESITIIKGALWMNGDGLVRGANNAELRFLTVDSQGWPIATSIKNLNSTTKITNVTAKAATSGNTSYAIVNQNSSSTITNVSASATGVKDNYGVYNISSSPDMTNMTALAAGGNHDNRAIVNHSQSNPRMTAVTATAQGAGVSVCVGIANTDDSYPVMNNVSASATGNYSNLGITFSGNAQPFTLYGVKTSASGSGNDYGFYMWGGIAKIDNALLTGTVMNDSGTLYIGNSKVDGQVSKYGTATVKCIGVYDGNYDPVVCP
jgi:hypothetical protein